MASIESRKQDHIDIVLQKDAIRLDVIRAYNGYLTARDSRYLMDNTIKRSSGALDLITERFKNNENYMSWYAVNNEQLPGNNNISVEVADDAVIIGYPRGYYDDVHLYPIVKSGIIASRWGAPFKGRPYFLIDAKLFPGSSGSIVVSKPQEITIADGKIMYAKEKQFAFLGIYSGEPFLQENPIDLDDMTIIRKKGFDLGIVWYGYLIDEIITNGVQLPTN